MAAVKLGRKDLAYWDLMQASMIDPKNKEIQVKLDQLQNHGPQKAKDDKQNCNVPIGLGMGVPLLRKSNRETQANKSEKVENTLVDSEKVNGMCCDSKNVVGTKDDDMAKGEMSIDEKIEDCVSCLSTESSNRNSTDVNSEGGSELENKGPSNISTSSVKEVFAEEEADSSNLKNSDPTESIYQFANRRKADSFLSIRERDYNNLKVGRSLQYFNPSSGIFITVRMVQPSNGKPIINGESGGMSRIEVPIVSEDNGMQVEFEEQSKEERSTITQEDQVGNQSLKCQNNGIVEEVAEHLGVDIYMGVNQPELEVISDYAQSSPATLRVGRKPCVVRKRRKKIAHPHTLYGAGKREAKRRAVHASSPNLYVCRLQPTGGKKRLATSWLEQYDGTRKKIVMSNNCRSAVSYGVSYVSGWSSLESCSNSMLFSSIMESDDSPKLPATHKMVLANSSGE